MTQKLHPNHPMPDDPMPQKIPRNFFAGTNADTRERQSPQKWLPLRSMRSTACEAVMTQS